MWKFHLSVFNLRTYLRIGIFLDQIDGEGVGDKDKKYKYFYC